MPKKLDLPDDKICAAYLNGINTVTLADKYNCSVPPILGILRDNGVEIRNYSDAQIGRQAGEDNPRYMDIPIEDIREKYLTGMGSNEIAKEYTCSGPTIIRKLRENGVEIRSNHEARIGRDTGEDSWFYKDLPVENICEDYLNGLSTVKIAKKYNSTDRTISSRLRDNGIKIRSISQAMTGRKLSQEDRERRSATAQGIPYEDWTEFSQQKYCRLFNLPLKKAIRLYFNNNCFMDNEPEENGRALCIHHVNFDKRCGCDATQFCIFVPVKNSWNIVFNGNKDKNRWYWYSFLMNKIFIEHPNYFTYHIPVWGMCELEYNYNYVFEKFRR